ncbi:hypothetical protein HS125_08380 [bacterium]|nr:hypothetical protein [bacterium]
MRKLAAGESQAFHVDVIYDDGTRSDVTPSSAAPEDRAILRVEPPTAATVSGNVITVAAGATGSFVVRALYREGSDTFSDEAVVTVGLSHLVELVPSPVKMTVVPGVFRSINYTARYDDGYETDVSTLVSVVTDRPEDMVVAVQCVKVNLTAIPGDFLCTGTYTDSHNDTRQAVTTVTMVGPKTAWERYRVTGGGYGLSGDFSPNGQKLAAGSGSGAINLYSVGVTPSQYQLTHVIPAHEGSISYLKFINNDKIISVGGDGSIAVWDLIVSSTTPVTRFYHDAPITAAQLSGAKLAFGDSLGNVGVYDYPSDATEWLSPIHSGPVTAIAVDVDTILSGGDDHRVKVIKRSDGTVLKTIVAHTEAIQSVGWMGASKFFILGGDNSLSFWRKSDLEIIDRYDYPAETSHAEYIGDQLYVGTNEPVATWVYNSDGLLLRWLEHPPSEGKVKKYLIDPSGKYILTGRASSKVVVETFFGAVEKVSKFSSFQFWEVGRGIFRGSLAHSFPLGTAFTSADGGKIFTQDPKRTMSWSFDVASGTTEGRVLLETGYFIAPAFAGLDFTADTRILATRVDVSIYMFDTFTNLLWKTLHTPGAGPFAISPDGSRMATSDFRTRLWDLGNLSLIREDTRVASSLDFRGNDRFLGGISGSSFVAIFNQDGLFFNGFDTAYPPAHLFVNALGTRAAVVTVQIVGDLFDVSYNYFLEVFDISNLSIEIPRVTPPIYLLTTKEDIFGGGEGQVGFRLAVSEDTALALVGAEGDRPVRLVNLNDGSTIREFLPPGGGGDLNLGAAAVGFTDNDDSVMIAWAEGFAELHRRVRPNDLDLLVSRVESGKAPHPGPLPQGEGKGMVERFLARMKTGGTLYVDAGAVYSTQSIAQYANGAQLNVTSTASLVSDNTAVATVSGRYVTIAANAPDGAVAALTASYDELGDELSATVTLKVGEPPRLPGDLNGDGKTDRLDLFIFSMWWMQPDSGTGANHLADMIDDDQINANDLLELIKWYHGALPGE